MDTYITELKKCKLPSEGEIKSICAKVKEILISEPNILRLNPPISICGDIHGQFYDLLELFKVGGSCKYTQYLFLGDFVDRGHHSIETFLYLILLKITNPSNMHLLRGNHESRSLTMVYGFYDECIRKFGSANVYKYITEVFDLLPIGAVVNNIFAVYGGLSPEVSSVDDIDQIYRKIEIPAYGIISDLMWSDPEDQEEDWLESNRGAGFTFGKNAVAKFNTVNNFSCIFRAHQLVDAGYHYMFDQTICIVWSAPNYCYRCGNSATILEIGENMERYFNMLESSLLSYTEDDADEYNNAHMLKKAYFL